MSELAEANMEVQAGESPTRSPIKPEDIQLPSSSYWPFMLALGFGMTVLGLALNLALGIAGLVIILVATIGWVIEPVHPPEKEH